MAITLDQVVKSFLAPSHLVMILRSGLLARYDVSSLKYINCAGAALPEATIKEAIDALRLRNLQQCKLQQSIQRQQIVLGR